MTSARPLAGQVPPVRNVRQPIARPEPVRTVRQPISQPAMVPQEEAAMEDIGEAMLEEEVSAPMEAPEEIREATEAAAPTMARPTALLKPIRGTLQPLVEEEAVRTAPLTPVGHMLMPEKKARGPPPSASIGRPKTAELRPVRGTLTPVSKKPVKQLKPDEDAED